MRSEGTSKRTLSEPTLSARFAGDTRAKDVVQALLAAGIPSAAISVTGTAADSASDSRFLGRIVVLIVLWSIPGGAVGALLGLALTLTGIGPDGTSGAAVQVVSWLIIGHLLAGMWAGYVLLADRTHRELAPAPAAEMVISVRCASKAELETAERVLGLNAR